METSKLLQQLSSKYEQIGSSQTDEQRFYALCDYLAYLRADYGLLQLSKRLLNSSKGIYISAAKSLSLLLDEESISRLDLWSQVWGNISGEGNRDLIIFTKDGAVSSVAKTVHEAIAGELKVQERGDRVELVLDDKNGSVYLKNDPSRMYEVKSKGAVNDKKRFQTILALYHTDKWLSIKELKEETNTSDSSTMRSQIEGVSDQFQKETKSEHPLIVRQKKGNKFTHQLNHERYFFSIKPTGA